MTLVSKILEFLPFRAELCSGLTNTFLTSDPDFGLECCFDGHPGNAHDLTRVRSHVTWRFWMNSFTFYLFLWRDKSCNWLLTPVPPQRLLFHIINGEQSRRAGRIKEANFPVIWWQINQICKKRENIFSFL